MEYKRIMGIDPGIEGAISVIDNKGVAVYIATMPSMKDLYSKIKEAEPDYVVIEAAFTNKNQGNKSNFTIGKNYGTILGTLYSYGVQVEEVYPITWKSYLRLVGGGKEAAVAMAEVLFPQTVKAMGSLNKKRHEGLAESLLIAEWGRQQLAKRIIDIQPKTGKKVRRKKEKQLDLFEGVIIR